MICMAYTIEQVALMVRKATLYSLIVYRRSEISHARLPKINDSISRIRDMILVICG